MSERKHVKHMKPLVKTTVDEIFPNYFFTSEFERMVDDYHRSMISSFAPFLAYPLTPTVFSDVRKMNPPLVDLVDRGDHYLINADLQASPRRISRSKQATMTLCVPCFFRFF